MNYFEEPKTNFLKHNGTYFIKTFVGSHMYEKINEGGGAGVGIM